MASRHDTHDQDLATGIDSCLTRDNQSKPTASFLPQTNNAYDLGSASFVWRAIYGYLTSAYIKYDQTPAEMAAGVTPVNYSYIPGHLFRYGAVGDGSTSDNTAITNAFKPAGQDVYVPRGYTFAMEGNVPITTGNRRVYGGGCFKKKGTTVQPIFTPTDGISGLWFDGIEGDGLKASFSAGNAVPFLLGYLLPDVKFTNCYLHDIIDSAIKLRDCAGLIANNNRFYNIGEAGIEIQNYVNDPRTGTAYAGSRPSLEGNHSITGNFFKKIDDGLHGTGNGCGVLFASISTAYPVTNIDIIGNTFEDVLLSIHTENNVAGSEARNVVTTGNTIRGNVAGSGSVETSDGINYIGVIGGVIQGNTLYNVGNITPPIGGDTSGILVSGTSTDIDISGNTVIDDTGVAIRTDYGIYVPNGTRISVHNNTVSGCSTANLLMDSAGCVSCRAWANIGAELQGSWGNVIPFVFTRQNIPATTNNVQLYPASGLTDWDEIPVPAAGRLVGVSVLLSAAISAGTITFKAFSAGTQRTNLNITQADFGGGVQATVRIATEDGVTIPAGSRLKIYCDTNGAYLPTTNDAIATLLFDATGNIE